MPNVWAQGVQISRMCSAFAVAGRDISLFHRKGGITNLTDTRTDIHYGLSQPIDSVPVWSPNFGRIFFFSPPASRLAAIGRTVDMSMFGFFAIKRATRMGFTRVYTREWQIAWLSTRRNISTTLELHEVPRSSMWRKFIKGISQRDSLTRIVVISNGVHDGLLEIGVDEKTVIVAPDAVDITSYENLPTRTEAREIVGLQSDRPLVVYTGSLFRYKGIHSIIEAAEKLSEVDFVVVGGSGAELENYRNAVNQAGVRNLVTTGYVIPQVISVYQAAADVLIAPNTSENKLSTDYTSPLKLFEYMASSRPVVASSLASIREILCHESTAILVEPDSPTDLAAGIKRLLEDPKLGESIANRARDKVSSNTWDRRAQTILKDVGW